LVKLAIANLPVWTTAQRGGLLSRFGIISAGAMPLIHPEFFLGAGGRLELGDRVFINRGFYCGAAAAVTIGANTRIADHVRFLVGTHEIGDHASRAGADVGRPITVGSGCWIGSGATIMGGVVVGDGCVVAAGSVVTHDCLADGLYAGVPACRIRELEES